MLSAEQLRAFNEVGAVTLDALGDRHHPLIDGLEEMLDTHAAPAAQLEDDERVRAPRCMVPMETRLATPAFLEWVSSEWLEQVACELLRTDRVPTPLSNTPFEQWSVLFMLDLSVRCRGGAAQGLLGTGSIFPEWQLWLRISTGSPSRWLVWHQRARCGVLAAHQLLRSC